MARPRQALRVGLGYDIHRLEPGEALFLAGVRVPCPYRAVAHSDGDVVLHALCDALLGALAAGDLGEHFPDTDPAHQGRASSEFVAEILAMEVMQHYRIGNIDVNIIAQAPRLGDHKAAMRINLARLFALPLDCVGLKARTNEHCDSVGEKRAIQAQAVVLLEARTRPRATTALTRRRRVGTEHEPATMRLAPKPPRSRRETRDSR
jgi:2-C-methyl-D-erythritol 2,4-cyclodiphosphate synthase